MEGASQIKNPRRSLDQKLSLLLPMNEISNINVSFIRIGRLPSFINQVQLHLKNNTTLKIQCTALSRSSNHQTRVELANKPLE